MKHPKSYYLKTCSFPDQYEQYAEDFSAEYQHMQNLYRLMEENGCRQLYERLFPYYDSFTIEPDGRPLLSIEKISGDTLEKYLCSQQADREPAVLIGKSRMLHIFEQLHDAVYWLHQGGMLQLDLSPQNILITSDDFDLCFIDFTGCYDINLSVSENIARGYKRIDNRLNSNAPLSCQLRDTCALFFTRLFFCGNSHYQTAFSTNPKRPAYSRCVSFFDRIYPHLLDCLFHPSSIPQNADRPLRSDWDSWYQALLKLLRSAA